MRVVAIGCGLLVLLLVGYVGWWAFNVMTIVTTTGGGPEVSARQLASTTSGIWIELRLVEQADACRVTEISAPRRLVEVVGLRPPEGFVDEPLPLTEDERRDPETVSWAAGWNRDHVRWVGSEALSPGEPLVLELPASSPAAATGVLSISYERKLGLGGMSSAATITLNAPPESGTSRPTGAEEGAG